MTQEILCPNPSCGKKYRLAGAVPAMFTCTKCGQSMDLSAFAPPAPPAPASRSARAGGAVRAGAGSRGRRGPAPEPEQEDRRERFQPRPQNNAALIWGSLGALVVAIVLVVVFMGGKDEPAPAPGGPEANAGTGTPSVGVPGLPGATVPGVPAAGVPTAGGTTPAGTSPGPAGTPEPGPGTPPPPRGSGLSPLKVWDPPAELNVSAEEKERIERALDTAINDTGRAVQEAQATLVQLDRKAIWRLVSEFKHIQDSLTFENRKGLVNAMIVDRILRMIDGYMERQAKVRDGINPESSPDWATGVAKRWNTWLDRGGWKTKLAPWDPRVDEQDEGAERPATRSGGAGGGR